ncbi:TVP38/TMEM64 family protein [Halorientalis halophila]|uniref:TVP38/TMEM64 family protein n=1 Tax=Halorientalis halophila TaxID=3108499 RepID=UPI003008D7F6
MWSAVTVFESRAARRRFLVTTVVALVCIAGLLFALRRVAPFLTDASAMREFVAGFGVFAPLVFVLIQIVQVVVAPIPGQLTGFVSGYLFGGFWGSVYSLLGLTIGSFLAFWLSRRFGRPFVEEVLDSDLLDRLDETVAGRGIWGFFIVFLVPGLPDDAVCLLGGLTEIDLWKLVLVALVGRAPSYVLVNVSGASLADENVVLSLAIVGLLLAASLWGLLNRDRIFDRLDVR